VGICCLAAINAVLSGCGKTNFKRRRRQPPYTFFYHCWMTEDCVRDEVDLRYSFIIIITLCGCGCVDIVIRVFQNDDIIQNVGAAVWTVVVERESVDCLCGC